MIETIFCISAIVGILAIFWGGLSKSYKIQEGRQIECSFDACFCDEDIPDCWIGQGIRIWTDSKGVYIKPPISKECIDFNYFNVFHNAEYIQCDFMDVLTMNHITIAIDYNELQQYSKEAVISYLFDRKIFV